MRIFLVRHPQTTANEKKIIYGKTDYPLTKVGEQQRDQVVKFFGKRDKTGKIMLMTSSAGRAYNLAEKIGYELSQSPIVDQRLKEMDFGIFEGLSPAQAEENYPKAYDDFFYRFTSSCIPEGESYANFQQRIQDFIASIEKTEDYLIVTHGAVIREMIESLLGLNPGDSWKYSINNGTIIEIEEKSIGFTIRQIIQPE